MSLKTKKRKILEIYAEEQDEDIIITVNRTSNCDFANKLTKELVNYLYETRSEEQE